MRKTTKVAQRWHKGDTKALRKKGKAGKLKMYYLTKRATTNKKSVVSIDFTGEYKNKVEV